MKAIIPAAGYATRLYPLTKDRPKSLLLVGGKPMLDIILDKIEPLQEITDVYVVTNAKFYPHFVGWSAQQRRRFSVHVINDGTSSNEDRLGAIGDICFAIENANIADDVLIIAGDNLFEFDMKRLIKLFEEKQAPVIGCYDVQNISEASKMGVVELDESYRIVGFEEKPEQPKSTLVSTMCYLFPSQTLTLLLEHKNLDRAGDFIKLLSENQPVYGYAFTEPWYDIGSHEQYAHVNRIYTQ